MKNFVIWFTAFAITISAAIYQRKTGPTYPQKAQITVNGQIYNIKLVRSLGLDEKPFVRLAIDDTTASAILYFRKYRTNDPWEARKFRFSIIRINSFLMNRVFGIHEMKGYFATLPQQPPAGKLQYYIEVTDSTGTRELFKDNPVVVRFKGAVPGWILTPHILLMFIAMLFSTAAGLMAIAHHSSYRKYSILTLVFLTAGGMILGPFVQYYAFGDFWTGIPLGWDLTDNKTLIAFIFWVTAVVVNLKHKRPLWSALAALVLLIVYSIPHSLFGSELDYESGKVIQGTIIFFFK